MHIAGPKDWTPIQQANMIYQTYISLLESQKDGDFVYESKLCKETAKLLGQPWNEIRKDIAIYRIFRQLQSARYMVKHDHYSKLQMIYSSGPLLKEYFNFSSESFNFDNIGLERFNDLFIVDNCAISNPQDFSKLKYIFNICSELERQFL